MSLDYELLPEQTIHKFEKKQLVLTSALEFLNLLNSLNPIEEDTEGKIHFHPNLMVENRYYSFNFKNKEYLIKKSNDKVVDFYEVK